MVVIWEVDYGVDDSPIAGTRPHRLVIPDDELEAYDTPATRQLFIEYCVEEDFRQHVSWTILDIQHGV